MLKKRRLLLNQMMLYCTQFLWIILYTQLLWIILCTQLLWIILECKGKVEAPRRCRWHPRKPTESAKSTSVKITVLLLPGSVQMSCRAIDLSVKLPGTGPVPMTTQLLFGGNSNGSRKRSFMLGSRRSRHTNFEWELRVPRRRRVLRRMLAVGKARGTAETGGGQGRRLRQF
ncbi:unnamed protein product [Prorocentrum cordatum]|uniref:Uncharacterized protein n=1 Tax=Prorocentrum cordatum TaxID=2364126 RepID=A0ABN9TEL8_9DINO|nr:unnamed protein product [Polarella glacialis]